MTDLTESEREEINRWWAEYMGDHRYKLDISGTFFRCEICGKKLKVPANLKGKEELIDYLSDAMFIKCLRKAKEDEEWLCFLNWYRKGKTGYRKDKTPVFLIDIDLMDSPTFQIAWREWKRNESKS